MRSGRHYVACRRSWRPLSNEEKVRERENERSAMVQQQEEKVEGAFQDEEETVGGDGGGGGGGGPERADGKGGERVWKREIGGGGREGQKRGRRRTKTRH